MNFSVFNSTFNFCREAIDGDPWGSEFSNGIFVFIVGGLQLLASLSILFYLYRQRRRAQRREIDEKTARLCLIFPLYNNILRALCATCVIAGLCIISIPLIPKNKVFLRCGIYGVSWSIFHCIFEGITFLFCNTGVGVSANRIAAMLSFMWGLTTMILQFYVCRFKTSPLSEILSFTWNIILFLYYVCMWLLPCTWFFRRPAIFRYAKFWCVSRFLILISDVFVAFKSNFGYCIYEISTAGLLSVFTPYVLYVALLEDSQYWQGLLHLQFPDSAVSIRAPLLGIHLDISSARTIAQTIDKTKRFKNFGKGVRILNFAFLQIEKVPAEGYPTCAPAHIVLGAGSSSRVFRGFWHGQPVAVKMIFCVNLTPEVITNFYQEASLLAGLVHTNVVEVYGICVLPPAICLVLELCEGGNLFNFLRQEQNLNWKEKLNILRQCGRSVAYLHNQVPPILHLDLKSSNFLITYKKNPIIKRNDHKNQNQWAGNCNSKKEIIIKVADLELSREFIVTEVDSTMTGLASGSTMQGYRVPETFNWLAPEIILGKFYNDKADVYSLAMCAWEVLTGKVPYGERTLHTYPRKCSSPRLSLSSAPASPTGQSRYFPITYSKERKSAQIRPRSLSDHIIQRRSQEKVCFHGKIPLKFDYETYFYPNRSKLEIKHKNMEQEKQEGKIERMQSFPLSGSIINENSISADTPSTSSTYHKLSNQPLPSSHLSNKSHRSSKCNCRYPRRLPVHIPSHQEKDFYEHMDLEAEMLRIICTDGYRPEIPNDCPPELSRLLGLAWHEDASLRPTSQQFSDALEQIYKEYISEIC